MKDKFFKKELEKQGTEQQEKNKLRYERRKTYEYKKKNPR